MKKVIIGLALVAASPNLFASVLVEPMLGYTLSGNTEWDANKLAPAQNYKFSYSGVHYGARLGLQYLGLMFGGQYDRTSASNFKQDGSNAPDNEVTVSNISLFAGMNFPLGIRVFGNYFISSSMDGQKDNAYSTFMEDNDSFSGGSGFGLGVGYKLPILPLAFNAEYRSLTYSEYELKAATPHTGDTQSFGNEVKTKEIIFTVSAPLTFL